MNIDKITGVLPRSHHIDEKRSYFIIAGMLIASLVLRLIFIGKSDLLTEEAYYWNYAQHLDFGYLDHPPMVALLIKCSTVLFGSSEFAVRLMTLICWGMTTYFSYQLTELMKKGAGVYVVMLTSILPFFFMYSLVMTPDVPLLVCWSAALYYLYQALCRKRARAWYALGVALGLGMLSKYSICLLVPAILLCLLCMEHQRYWFLRKEPYLAALIAMALFTPVIYWNAKHHWASFAFQSTRRFHSDIHFSLHALLGLVVLFLMPVGVKNAIQLFSKRKLSSSLLDKNTLLFIKMCTFLPLSVFVLFSVSHEVKFNWIGPCLLALMPYLAICISTEGVKKLWFVTGAIVLIFYAFLVASVSFGTFPWLSKAVLNKYIDWNRFTQQMRVVAQSIEQEGHTPVFIPLDTYSISSELAYYQFRQKSLHPYPVIGAQRFNYESLMYRYWADDSQLAGKYAIIIAVLPFMFENALILQDATLVTPPTLFLAYSQGRKTPIRQYYYEVVHFNA